MNAAPPMLSSESGKAADVSEAHLLNAPSPIVFSPLPKVTVASAAQPENAFLSIVSSESGKATEVRLPQFMNA